MADDEAPISAADPVPAAAPEPAPAAAEPAAAPAAEPSLLETAGAEAPADVAPVAEGEPAPVSVEGKTEGEGNIAKLLGEGKEKPGEKKEGQAAAEPVQLEPIVYGDFTMPEGVSLGGEQLAAATQILGAARVPQEEAQKLIDAHATALREYAEHTGREQHRVFNETRKGWQNEIMADPEMGGSAMNTTKAAVAGVRDRFVAPADMPAFNEMLRVTGVGDHPQFWRLLHNVSKAVAEPAPPPPNPAPVDNPTTKGRRATLYDHPKSA